MSLTTNGEAVKAKLIKFLMKLVSDTNNRTFHNDTDLKEHIITIEATLAAIGKRL